MRQLSAKEKTLSLLSMLYGDAIVKEEVRFSSTVSFKSTLTFYLPAKPSQETKNRIKRYFDNEDLMGCEGIEFKFRRFFWPFSLMVKGVSWETK